MAETETKSNGAAVKADKKAREGRSPAFPFLDLGKALERAEQFRVAEGKHLVPVASAKKAWKLGEDGGAGRRTVAALGHFGLFTGEGTADDRKVRLTPDALLILLDKQPISPERDELIQKAALAPPIHKELWGKWRNELPSEATIETYLVRDRGFSSMGARDLIQEYKATLAFAKLLETGIMSVSSEAKVDADADPPPAKVGDFIQWTSGGVDQFNLPARVLAVSKDGQWLWVAETKTGIPMAQVQIVSPPSGGADQQESKPPAMPAELAAALDAARKPKSGMKEEKNSLDEGEAVLIWPENLSADSVRDLEYWLKGVLKKAKRRAGIDEEAAY